MKKIKVMGQGSCQFDGHTSILNALDENGFDINHNCCNGYCGVCRVRLITGEVENTHSTLYEPLDGEILTCSTIPSTDIEIELN